MSLIAHGADGSTLDELLTFSEVETLDQLTSVASKLVNTLNQPQPEPHLDDSQSPQPKPDPDDPQSPQPEPHLDDPQSPQPDYSPDYSSLNYSPRGHKRKFASVDGDWNDDYFPLSDYSQRGHKLTLAGGAWIDNTLYLSPSFISCAENIYKVKVEAVNFKDQVQEVVNKVNKWAEESTCGIIKSILTTLSPNTILVLANALHFKGTWEKEFCESLTRDSDFYLENGETVQVPFMCSDEDQFIRKFDDFKVLRLPYINDYGKEPGFSMHIVLPHQRYGL